MKKKSKGNLILFIILIVYLMSPVDLVSDVIPVVGQIDDTAIAIIDCLAMLWLKGRENQLKDPDKK